jgi:hypothetical protein
MKFALTLLFVLLSQCVYPQDFWKQLPGPAAGRITCFTHEYMGYVYAGTQDNGLYRSSDKGSNWSPLGFYGNAILSLAIEDNFLFASTVNSGVQRSSDNGAHWTSIYVGSSSAPKKLLATGIGDLFAGADDGMYRSEDDGDSWTPVSSGIVDKRILAITVSAHNTLYASTYRSGVFRSEDNGDSWQQIINGLGSARIRSLIVDPSENVYAGSENNGIFLSTDFGDTWIQVFKYAGWTSLDINFLGDLFAMSSTGTLLFTSDKGSSWRSVAAENLVAQAAVVSVNVDGSILNGTNGSGIYKAVARDSVWISTGLQVSSATAFRATSNGAFIISTLNGFTDGGGCYITTDNGNSWQITGLTGYRLQSLEKQATGTFIAGGPDGIFRSTDNGVNWSPLITGANPNQLAAIIAGVPNYFFAAIGPTGVFRSYDDGVSWSTSGLTGIPITSLSSDAGGSIYACTPQGLYRTTNNGVPWTQLPITSGIDTAVSFIRAGSRLIAATNAFIYYSNDEGATWTPSISTAEAGNVRMFGIHNIGEVFAATSKGVYESADSGLTWSVINTGMPSTNVVSIGFDKQGYVYAGSADLGIFRSTQIISGIHNVLTRPPASYALHQNYPNPFNPSTKISFDLPRRDFIVLKIFNLLGEEVTTLVNDYRNAGTYTVEFNAGGLSSGIYFSRLTLGSYSEQRKMLLIR